MPGTWLAMGVGFVMGVGCVAGWLAGWCGGGRGCFVGLLLC